MFCKMQKELKRSITFRIFFFYQIVFMISFSVIFFVLYCILENYLYNSVDKDLVDEVSEIKQIHKNLKDSGRGMTRLQKLIQVECDRENVFTFIAVRNQNWQTIAKSSAKNWAELASPTRSLPKNINFKKHYYHYHYISGALFRTLHSKGPSREIFEVSVCLAEQQFFLNYVVYFISIAYVVTLLAFWILGNKIIQATLKPVTDITKTAQKISLENLSERLPLQNADDEFGQLATTLNGMLDRMALLVSIIQEKNDHLAHNIRTPISRIRLNAEITLLQQRHSEEYRDTIGNVIEECDSALDMLNTILQISEMEAGISVEPVQTFELGELMEKCLFFFQETATSKGVELSLTKDKNCYLPGNSQKLEQAFSNLIDNAIKYTNAGSISVSLQCSDKPVVIIQDTGIGIPKEEQKNIFQRFYRCKNAYPNLGSGLGLSFVKAVVESHNGMIFVNSKLNCGTTFTVQFF